MEHGSSLKSSFCKEDSQINVNPSHNVFPAHLLEIHSLCWEYITPLHSPLENILAHLVFIQGGTQETILLMFQLIQVHLFSLLSNHIALLQRPPKFCQWTFSRERLHETQKPLDQSSVHCVKDIFGAAQCWFKFWSDRGVIQGHQAMVHEMTAHFENHHQKSNPNNHEIKLIHA